MRNVTSLVTPSNVEPGAEPYPDAGENWPNQLCWLCQLPEALALISNPWKWSFMTKLTTPATASAPYTADAPPVRTSTRSTRAIGMLLRSAELAPMWLLVASPGIRRRPLISTNVRCGPKPRRLTLDVPEAPLEAMLPWSATTCGRLLSTSSIEVVPCDAISFALIAVTGLIDFSPG